jgi:nucleoside-diphosphate-sugar epimerase
VSVWATGMSGVIGRNLMGLTEPLKIDLSCNELTDIDSDLYRCKSLIHLAGIVGEQKVKSNEEYAYNVNVRGAANLARSYHQKGKGLFVYVSTSHVYKPSSEFLTEESEVGPVSTYGMQKLLAEKLIESVFEDSPERLVIVRLFSILGEGMPDFSLGGAIRRLVADPQFLLNNCDDIRDFLTPQVAAQSIFEIAQATGIYGTFNLCSGQAQSIKDAVLSQFAPSLRGEFSSRLLGGNSIVPSIKGTNVKLLEYLPQMRKSLIDRSKDS